MMALFLSAALSTLTAGSGSINFQGAVVASTCTYDHDASRHVVRTWDCYKGVKPMVTGPVHERDQAIVQWLGKSLPTWRLTYL
jgi:hypothetical protein